MQEIYKNNYSGIRRNDREVGNPVRFGDITLNLRNKEMFNSLSHKKIPLTPKEYQIMNMLIHSTNSGVPISSSEIHDFLYDDFIETKELSLNSNPVSVYLNRLRKKLKLISSEVSIPRNSREFRGHKYLVYNQKEI